VEATAGPTSLSSGGGRPARWGRRPAGRGAHGGPQLALTANQVAVAQLEVAVTVPESSRRDGGDIIALFAGGAKSPSSNLNSSPVGLLAAGGPRPPGWRGHHH
jgi:hypothetical protein